MLCVNCKNEVNVGGNICPYCHTQPFVYGSAPYSSGTDSNEQPNDPRSALAFWTFAGVLAFFVFPPLAVVPFVIGLVILLRICFKK